MAKITCTACGESWKPSKPVAPGKRVRCPECSEIFVVADDDAEPDAPRSRRSAGQIEAPRRRKGPVAEQASGEDDAPRRRRPRDDDDYDDERPRKGNKPAGKRGLLIGLIAGGTGLVVMAAVVAMIMNSGGNRPTTSNSPVTPAVATGHEFHSLDGKYKVTFPGIPKEKTENASGVAFRSANLELRDGAYVAGYSEIPLLAGATPDMVQKGLIGGQDGALRNVNATATSQNSITLNGKHPGREFTGRLNGPQKGEIRAKLFVVGPRFYQVFVVGQESWVRSQEVDRFLNSFTVEDPGEVVGGGQPTGGPGPRGKKKK